MSATAGAEAKEAHYGKDESERIWNRIGIPKPDTSPRSQRPDDAKAQVTPRQSLTPRKRQMLAELADEPTREQRLAQDKLPAPRNAGITFRDMRAVEEQSPQRRRGQALPGYMHSRSRSRSHSRSRSRSLSVGRDMA